jgi:hypothetical protein
MGECQSRSLAEGGNGLADADLESHSAEFRALCSIPLLIELFVIDLPVSRGAVIPDHMEIAEGNNGNDGKPGIERSPGESWTSEARFSRLG